jgi:integrase
MPKEELTVESINNRLKLARIRVRVRQKGDALYLRATLPPKPDSNRQGNIQHDLALGVAASLEGLKLAESEAKILGGLLDQKKFNWDLYIKDSKKEEEIAQLVARFKLHYLSTHRLKERTWNDHWAEIYSKLPQSSILDGQICFALVNRTERNSRLRYHTCSKLQHLADFAGLSIDLLQFKGNYGKKKSEPRDIPSDDLIEKWRGNIPNPDWQWLYGVIAAYGLRPHEPFFCEFGDNYILRVLEGKTGPREVRPLHREWAERWNLTERRVPPCSGQDYQDYGHRTSNAYDRYGVPFGAYDCRHAWCIRGTIVYQIPVPTMANMAGHSIEEHYRTYQRWISKEMHQQAYDRAISSFNRLPSV